MHPCKTTENEAPLFHDEMLKELKRYHILPVYLMITFT